MYSSHLIYTHKIKVTYQAFISMIVSAYCKNRTIVETAAIRCYVGGMGENILDIVQSFFSVHIFLQTTVAFASQVFRWRLLC